MSRTQWILLGVLAVQLVLIAVLRSPASTGGNVPGRLVEDFDATKIAAFEQAGIGVMKRPAEVVELLKERM